MSVLKAFNNHLIEFIDDILKVIPEDTDLQTSKFFIKNFIKIKSRGVVELWKFNIGNTYRKEIEKGNFDFFINKDYSYDIGKGVNGNRNDILEYINKIRFKISDMSINNKNKAMKYIQNLTKLSDLYYKKN